MTAYRNDQARTDSEAANRALEREARNTRLMVFWSEVFLLCALGVTVAALIAWVLQ